MARRLNGFILIDLVLTLAIVGILAAIAIPAYGDYTKRAIVAEALNIIPPIRDEIGRYYAYHGRFPGSNADLGLQAPHRIATRYIESVEVEDGAIHVRLRDSSGWGLAGEVLSVRPTLNKKHGTGPLVWYCGYAVDTGRMAVGRNATTLEIRYLPFSCH